VAPDFPAPAWLQAEARAQRVLDRGDWAAGLALARAAWDQTRAVDDAHLAAVFAQRLGHYGDALAWLARSTDAGYSDADLGADPIFAPLHGRPEWAAIAAKAKTNPTPARPAMSPELAALLHADEDEHNVPPNQTPAFLSARETHDAERRAAASKLLASGKIKTAHDYLGAAQIFTRGSTDADFAQARSLALEAVHRGALTGYLLAAQTWDRWLLATGHPQHFGTQFRSTSGGGPFTRSLQWTPRSPTTSAPAGAFHRWRRSQRFVRA
jgi:hypothetical protein